MNQTNNSPFCERASDLIAFLYNEADENEICDFELHLKECRRCREEVGSFGFVRESITAWRDEALSGFVSAPLATNPGRKSAIAALRQFFDLSPLWLKAATGFAVLALCVLAALAIVRVPVNKPVVSNSEVPNAVYTEQDVDRIVKEALAKQESAGSFEHPGTVTVAQSSKPKGNIAPSQTAKNRRPLSRAEREQLAADLRLLTTDDEDSLDLLGDRINQ
jgi:hypothetical protein